MALFGSSKKRKILALAAWLIILGIGAAAYAMWPKVDDIPDELEAIDPEVSLADLELEAQGPLPAVRIGDLKGKTVYMMIEGKESMTGDEGKLLRRAMHRWVLPDDVVGLSIGDAPAGARVMRNKIETEFVGPMREEMKLPIYIDFGGDFTTALSLPKGHFGFAILSPEGELALRLAGDADAAKLEEIKALLGAEDPPQGPMAPDFEIGELDNNGLNNDACAGRICVLMFLDQKVVRADIPGLEDGGFEGEMKETFAQIKKPSVRLARIVAADWEAEDRANMGGVIVGEAEGWEVEGWPFVAQAPQARDAFGIGEDAGMVILDAEGRVAFSEAGLIPFWKLSLAADVLGIEPKDYGKRKKDESD